MDRTLDRNALVYFNCALGRVRLLASYRITYRNEVNRRVMSMQR